MIPKIIHYCWLSGDEFPTLIKDCMDTWKKRLPDYEFILWDTERFDLNQNQWAKEAFEAKKYAFAADYIRLYAVYHHGGIYLDTDIEVLKSFDPLLRLPYFMGSEGEGVIEAGVFGAKKNSAWVSDCLEYYEDRPFLKEDGGFNILTLPRVIMQQLGENYTVEELVDPVVEDVGYTQDDKTLYMFPSDYFCAKNHGTGIIEKTDNTFCIHHFAMSWLPKSRTMLPNFKRKLIGIFGLKFMNSIIKFFQTLKFR